MKFDLVSPCGNCPFRTDITFHLDGERVEEIIDAITRKQQTFACHKTTQHDDEDEHILSDKEQHCAGALILLEKMEQPNQMMRISERFGGYDRTKLKMDSPVFEDGDDMIDHFYNLG